MFELSFTRKDLIRAAWAFLAGGIGAYVTLSAATNAGGTSLDAKALIGAVITAGLVSVKNLILADGSVAKG